MSLQSQNAVCGHMETDDAPCNCYVARFGPVRQGGQVADPLAWMDEVGHTNERTKHEKEWIAVMRKRFSDAGGSGTGDYCMWLEERLYALEARRV